MFFTPGIRQPSMSAAVQCIFGRRSPAEIRPVIVVPAAIAMCDLMLRSRLRADESERDQTMDEDIMSDAALRKPDSHIAEAIPSLP